MSLIAKILRPFARWTQAKVAVNDQVTVEWDPASFTLTPDPILQRVVVTVAASPVLGDITASSIHVTGNATVDGTIVQGVKVEVVGAATTTGAASTTLLAVPIVANAVAMLDFRVLAAYVSGVGTYSGIWQTRSAGDVGYYTTGSPAPFGSADIDTPGNCGIAASISIAYSAGSLTFTCTGPTAAITGIADSGSGKCRFTVSAAILDSALSTKSVTVSGVTGTGGLPAAVNGAHVATYVDATHFDFASVNFVGAYTSGGAAVFTTPPVLKWAARVAATVAGP